MSRIRHLVWGMQPDARNSSGDENAREAKPNSFSKSGSDSRTDSSSSTTDTSERVTVIDFSCRAHSRRLRQRKTRCIGARVGEEVDVPVRECCPCQSGQRIDDETVFLGDLFSAGLHSRRVRHSGMGCLLDLGMGLRYRFANQRCGTVRRIGTPRRKPKCLSQSGNGSYRRQIHTASVTPGTVATWGRRGIENENAAPGPLFSVAHRRPW